MHYMPRPRKFNTSLKVVQKCFNNLEATAEVLDARKVTCSKFRTDHLQIFGATVKINYPG